MPTPLELLRYHVTGAIERGEAEPIVEIKESDMLTVSIHLNSVAATATPHGEISATIEANREPVFIGNARDAAHHLEHEIPVGQSVEVRRHKAGRFNGSRSCMNKPALWADVAAYGES